VVEIGQQLAWLGAALRSSPSWGGMAYSTPKITTLTGAEPTFKISFQVEAIQSEQQGAELNRTCWRHLFRNPVIVQGFPILTRSLEEKGLEIPLNMMARLGEASRATNFGDGIVIKEFSTMFCPTKRIKDSILWHYLFERDGSRISYLSADSRCPSRARIQSVDAACLQASRNFLGWASSVEIHTGEVLSVAAIYNQADVKLGTKDAKYQDIEWPRPSFASAGIAFDKASIIVGSYVTGGASFTRGKKDTPIYLRREGPYEQEIHSAYNMKVVLYDTEDRRGWLIDGAAALLHITRTQLCSSPYSDSELFKLDKFHHIDPTDMVYTAKKALLDPRNRELLIFEEVETSNISSSGIGQVTKTEVRKTTKNWTYQDLVRQTYHILEQIHDYEAKMMTSAGLDLRFTDRDKLTGFAFMDIVDSHNDLRPRVAILKSSGRGWVDFTRTIRATTLMGRGYGEIIKPSKDSNTLCKYWKSVPKGKDYLVACISTLKDICRKHGDHDSKPMELANGIFWHKPDKLFESCECKITSLSKPCDRIQVLLPPSLGSKIHPQPFGHENGAVIFGRSRKFLWHWPRKGEPVGGGHSDSDPDDSSDFRDSGLGESYPSNSENSMTGNLGSSSSISSDAPPRVEATDMFISDALQDGPDSTTQPILDNTGPSPIDNGNGTCIHSYTTGSAGLAPLGTLATSLSESQDYPVTTSTVGTPLTTKYCNTIPLENSTTLEVRHRNLPRTECVKRTWDQVKEMTPQIFPRKKSKTNMSASGSL
jgi:hypothetical protein